MRAVPPRQPRRDPQRIAATEPGNRFCRRRRTWQPDRNQPGLLLRADMAIVPCKASMLEVRALAKATEVLRQAQDIRSGMPSAVIVLSMIGKNYRLTQDMKDAAPALDLPLASKTMTSGRSTPTHRDRALSSGIWSARRGGRPGNQPALPRNPARRLPQASRRNPRWPSQSRSSVKEDSMAERPRTHRRIENPGPACRSEEGERVRLTAQKGEAKPESAARRQPSENPPAAAAQARVPLSTRMRAILPRR